MQDLKNKIKTLEANIRSEADIDAQIELTKKLYETKLALLEKIHLRDKQRAGVEAKKLIELVDAMPRAPRYETGIRKLDQAMNGGFETGMFINLAGESYAGKTTLLLSILANVSVTRQTVFFNLEMGNKLIVKKLKQMHLSDTQLTNLIIDATTTDIDDLIMEISLYAEDGVKFFAIDSKMKLTSKEVSNNEYQAISRTSSKLARLAYEKDIIIFLINQMSEDSIKTRRLAFKGSGDQKYDSDIAFFIILDRNNTDTRKLICAKNRQEERLFTLDLALSDYRASNSEPEIIAMGAII